MKTCIRFLGLMLLCAVGHAQTWVKVGNQWASYTANIPVTVRVGYADLNVWSAVTNLPAGVLSVYPLVPTLPTGAISSSGVEVDVQQSGVAIEIDITGAWNNACNTSTSSVWYIPASGAAVYEQSACATPTVVPPLPVTVAPAAPAVCLLPSTLAYNKDGSLDIHVSPYCMLFQKGGAYGFVTNLTGYSLILAGDPTLAPFSAGNGTNLPQ